MQTDAARSVSIDIKRVAAISLYILHDTYSSMSVEPTGAKGFATNQRQQEKVGHTIHRQKLVMSYTCGLQPIRPCIAHLRTELNPFLHRCIQNYTYCVLNKATYSRRVAAPAAQKNNQPQYAMRQPIQANATVGLAAGATPTTPTPPHSSFKATQAN